MATVWRLDQGWYHSNWAAAFNLIRQRLFLFHGDFLKNVPWRPTVVVEYIAWFLIPLVAVAVLNTIREIRSGSNRLENTAGRHPRGLIVLCAWIGFFVVSVLYGWKVVGLYYDASFVPGSHLLMPYLGQSYDILHVLGEPIRWLVTAIALVGGALFTPIIIARYLQPSRERLTRPELVLDLTMLFSFGLTLIFCLFWDLYLLIYLPYGLIVVGKHLEPALLRWRRLVIGLCTLLLAGAAIWTYEDLAKNEATWGLCERMHAKGVAPDQIFSDWRWLFYWDFEDYVHEGHVTPTTTYHELFEGWMKRKQAAAEYWVVHEVKAPPDETWTVVDQSRYFSFYARGMETFYTVHRVRKPR